MSKDLFENILSGKKLKLSKEIFRQFEKESINSEKLEELRNSKMIKDSVAHIKELLGQDVTSSPKATQESADELNKAYETIKKVIEEDIPNQNDSKKIAKETEASIKKYFNDLKDFYNNYKSLDDDEKKDIMENASLIQKDKLSTLRNNLKEAFNYFIELNSETSDYYKALDDSLINEVNNKAKTKMNKEKQNKLACNLFEDYIIRVESSVFGIQMKDNVFDERELYKVILSLIELHKKVIATYDLVNDDIRDKYYIKLNDTAKMLYKMIDYYNQIAKSSISIMKKPIIIDDNNSVNIANTVIGVTNDNNIDLFRIIKYKEDALFYGRYNKYSYNEGVIFKGMITDEIAIKRIHVIISDVDFWAGVNAGQVYNNKMYCVTTSRLKDTGSFDKMREEMYKKRRKIMPYRKENCSTEEEIYDVLAYTKEVYNIENSKQKVL